ncbi:MAG: sigma-70 family RNA polymerase sigma factor [Candidatus Acidiferrales bacterium]
MSDLAHVLPWSQDEAELVTELQGGSGAAFDWLVTHYSGAVYSLVAGMVLKSSDAADITQDVFLKAFRGIRGFRRGSSLKTWLYRIAIREALNHKRWLWRHHREQDSIDQVDEDSHLTAQIEDSGSTPFDQAASHEAQEAVRKALRSVPQVFRSAVILRDLEGMSYEEVAEVLGVSTGTVKSRILRGRKMLREILEPILRNPHLVNIPAPRASHHASRLPSTLFPAPEKNEAGQSDTIGWSLPGKLDGAEGGVE